MSSNKIGSGGRILPVDDGVVLPLPLPKPAKSRLLNWPSGRVPKVAVKGSETPDKAAKTRDWRSFWSTCGELAGISAISVGAGWYSPGLGLIVAGIGVLVVSTAAGITTVYGHELQGKPETR